MDINRLHSLLPDMAAFVLVVEHGGFSAAAAKLGVTASSMSRKITRLEEALSIKLLERTTRQIALSDQGREIFQFCESMLDSARLATDASSSKLTEPGGCLRISAPKAFAKKHLEPLLIQFLDKYPQVQIKARITDREINLISDDVDVLFRLSNTPIEGLVAKPLGHTESVLCASPKYLDDRGRPEQPKDLSDHDCLYLGEIPGDNEWEFTQGENKLSVKVQGRYAINHSSMRLNAINRGLGIGVLPDFIAQESLEKGEVERVLEDWTLSGAYQGNIAMQYAQSKYLPMKTRVFVDFIAEQYGCLDCRATEQ